MLALAPGTRTASGTGATTGPRTGRSKHPYRKSCSCPACVLHFQFADERVFAELHHAGYDAWLDHVWSAAVCTRPVRLRGDIKHIDAMTGELLRTIPTIGMPDGVLYKPCGNRRVSVCPGCAETYRRDAYHIIRAGLIGGKGITPDVAAHPAVFATFTAPSFGPVHSRPVRQHTCADRSRCRCRPQPCHARRRGLPMYRVPSGNGTYRLVPPVRVAHGKAAEYQARGAVHFHALLRLDGYDPYHPDQILPPPYCLTIADLDEAVRQAVTGISFRTDPHPAQPEGWLITWGTQLDIRIITLTGTGAVTDLAVAAYLAKYSTKGTEVTGHASARITPETLGLYASPDGTHSERLISACWTIGQHPDYTR